MVRKGKTMKKPLPEYDIVKAILIKHDVLHKDIDQLDDPILMQDLFDHFAEDMPYGTQKARDGDPDEYIYDKLEDLGLPLGE
jgi:tRNA G10  N-methylase Trm11